MRSLIGQVIRFEARDLDGNTVTSEALFGSNRVTLVNVWGTWCPYCVQEMAELAEIHTRLQEKGIVRGSDVFAELSRQAAGRAEFSLIFCDPPYHRGLWQQALRQIDASDGLMAENGILVVEHGAEENEIPELSRLQLVHNRRYGHTTQLSFFQWRAYVEAEEEES
jgi:16S rRNA G966 N2-methylase RsmD